MVNYSKSQGKGSYKVGNMIFPSKLQYSLIASIDRNLKLLYSSAPPKSKRNIINYSPFRDDEECFKAILDRVERCIFRFGRRVEIEEIGDADFKIMFCGIIYFFSEVYNYDDDDGVNFIEETPEYIKERFLYLANMLFDFGIVPYEF